MRRADSFDDVLAAAQEGQEWAVTVLYRDVHPGLSRFLQIRERKAADDLEGEVWLAVAQRLAQFVGDEDGFRAWVFSIARRRLADYRRSAARRATAPVPVDELDRPDRDETEALVLGDLAAADAAAFVMATLSSDQADIVLLRVLGGLSVEQVAEMMGKPPGTVRVLQHRAIRRLHAALLETGVTR
jgi:RNA polymerase sigma-70 factor (ECF subfamily)